MTNNFSSKLDWIFFLSLILTIPTVPFLRFSVGDFEIPLAVPITATYLTLKLVALLSEDQPIDLHPVISGILVVFLLWTTASLLWSSSIDRSMRLLAPRTWQICLALMAINWCDLAPRSLRRLGGLFVLAVLIPVLIGYYGFLTAAKPMYYQFSHEFPRLLGDRNSDTFMILTAIPFALATVLVRSFRPIWRLFGFIAILLMATAIFFSLSRGNLLVMILLVSVLTLTSFLVFKARASSLLGVGGLCLAVFILFSVMPTTLVDRSVGRLEKRLHEVGEDRRWRLSRAALELAARHPFTGVGLANFGVRVQTTDSGRYVVSRRGLPMPHNSFLGTFAELGFPGLMLFTMVILWPLFFLVRLFPHITRSRDPTLHYLFVSGLGLGLVLVQGILAYDFAEYSFFWVAYVFNAVIVLTLDRSLRSTAHSRLPDLLWKGYSRPQVLKEI
jgi:O-antigen ligase